MSLVLLIFRLNWNTLSVSKWDILNSRLVALVPFCSVLFSLSPTRPNVYASNSFLLLLYYSVQFFFGVICMQTQLRFVVSNFIFNFFLEFLLCQAKTQLLWALDSERDMLHGNNIVTVELL